MKNFAGHLHFVDGSCLQDFEYTGVDSSPVTSVAMMVFLVVPCVVVVTLSNSLHVLAVDVDPTVLVNGGIDSTNRGCGTVDVGQRWFARGAGTWAEETPDLVVVRFTTKLIGD